MIHNHVIKVCNILYSASSITPMIPLGLKETTAINFFIPLKVTTTIIYKV